MSKKFSKHEKKESKFSIIDKNIFLETEKSESCPPRASNFNSQKIIIISKKLKEDSFLQFIPNMKILICSSIVKNPDDCIFYLQKKEKNIFFISKSGLYLKSTMDSGKKCELSKFDPNNGTSFEWTWIQENNHDFLRNNETFGHLSVRDNEGYSSAGSLWTRDHTGGPATKNQYERFHIDFQSELKDFSCERKSSLCSDFKKLLNNEELSDSIIKCENGNIHVIKSILICRSPFFKTMFEIKMNDSKDHIFEAPIKEIQKESYQKLMEYVYTDDIEELDMNQINDIFVLADFFMLDDLKNLLKIKLIHELETNFEKIKEWKDKHDEISKILGEFELFE
jgi:hypothetical protein